MNKLRFKFLKSNNTIVIEKNTNHLTTSDKPVWQWWYEIDLDKDISGIVDLLAQIHEKTWMNWDNFQDLLRFVTSTLIKLKK